MIGVALALLCTHGPPAPLELTLLARPDGAQQLRLVRRVGGDAALELRRLFDRDRSGALDEAEAAALGEHLASAARDEAGVSSGEGGALAFRTVAGEGLAGPLSARPLSVATEATRPRALAVTIAPRRAGAPAVPLRCEGPAGPVTLHAGAKLLGHALPASLSPGERLTLDAEPR